MHWTWEGIAKAIYGNGQVRIGSGKEKKKGIMNYMDRITRDTCMT